MRSLPFGPVDPVSIEGAFCSLNFHLPLDWSLAVQSQGTFRRSK